MRIRKDKDFISFFDEHTGSYLRTGILKEGKDTGVDPFQASFPELLDVRIMGHCIHGSRGLCVKAGVECYQNGLSSTAPNMDFADLKRLAEECRGRCFQFALGGCGDPDQHERFEDILACLEENEIVPNFTTSGLGLDGHLASLCARYCGAVAVSWYKSPYTLRAIDLLLEAGVKTNVHYVLGRSTLEEALQRLKNRSFPQGINALVFLLHKPVGQGSLSNVIPPGDPLFEELLEHVGREDFPWKTGFDSCTVPALIRREKDFCLESLDTCEGARFSAYISSQMQMMPGSFDNQGLRWAVSLQGHSVEEAWNSDVFEDFRLHFKKACPDCERRSLCMGGCPICPEIVLCPEKR